jgi:hypothetical protein
VVPNVPPPAALPGVPLKMGVCGTLPASLPDLLTPRRSLATAAYGGMQRKTGCTGCAGAALPQPAAASAPGANAQSVVPAFATAVSWQVKWLGQSLSCLHAMSFSSQRFSPLGWQVQAGGAISAMPASTGAPASASGGGFGSGAWPPSIAGAGRFAAKPDPLEPLPASAACGAAPGTLGGVAPPDEPAQAHDSCSLHVKPAPQLLSSVQGSK